MPARAVRRESLRTRATPPAPRPRGHGLPARYGGEEFAWLLPGGDLEPARLQCGDMREAIACASGSVPVTISTCFTRGAAGDVLAEVVRCADGALYATRRGRRNRVQAA